MSTGISTGLRNQLEKHLCLSDDNGISEKSASRNLEDILEEIILICDTENLDFHASLANAERYSEGRLRSLESPPPTSHPQDPPSGSTPPNGLDGFDD